MREIVIGIQIMSTDCKV